MSTKSPLKYHGGKTYLAPQIVSLMPKHKRYAEVFFGGGSVLFAKPYEGISEFVNDLDGDLIDFWKVLRDTPDRILRTLWATPFSEIHFDESINNFKCPDRVLRATGFFIRNRMSRQGLGKDFATPTSRTRRGMNEQVSAYLSAIEGLPEIHARLKRVEIHQRDFTKFIEKLDSPETFFYIDPPYPNETLSITDPYKQTMTLDQHVQLLKLLGTIQGKFILSTYKNKTYTKYAKHLGWHSKTIKVPKHSSSQKNKPEAVEVLYANYPLT